MSSLPFEKRKSSSLICHFRKDVQEIIRSLRNDFSELLIKEYHGKYHPVETLASARKIQKKGASFFRLKNHYGAGGMKTNL